METRANEKGTRTPPLRKTARILDAVIVAFLLFFGIGAILEGRGRGSPQSMALISVIGLGMLVLYGAGLVAAFKWERVGAVVAGLGLGSIFVMLAFRVFPGGGGGFGFMGVLNPILLFFWVPIVLFVLSSRRESHPA